jgi:hypothetical protein
MGGFFMHSRYGLKTAYMSSEWFECVSACIAKARELGMKAYLYDEDRWPSGAAGGAVTRDKPDFRMHVLQACRPGRQVEGSEPLATFAVKTGTDDRLISARPVAAGAGGDDEMFFSVGTFSPSGWHNDGTYVDTMNGDAVDEFIALTHQAYADRYGKDFGGLIPAIFTDEPNYYHPYHNGVGGEERNLFAPWTPELPREFIKRRGYDLRDHLPEVFFAPAGGFSKARHDYHQTMAELFVEAFTARIGRWCDKYGLALTGHLLGEGGLRQQIGVVGSCMPHYVHMQWPGIDILTDQADELLTAKQCSSVAAQFGKRRVLSELYGCTGWDWPLSGHKFIGDWQLAAGVNLRCPHLTHYSLAGGGKRDYPASIFKHSPWWKYYRGVEDYFSRLCFMLTCGRPLRDVLVIHPIESGWGVYRHGATKQSRALGELDDGLRKVIYALAGRHWDFDLADESILAEHGRAAGSTVAVGEMTYKAVVVPPCLTLRATTVELLERFAAAGGKLLFAGKPAGMVDCEKSSRAAELAEKADRCEVDAEEISAGLEAGVPRTVSIRGDGKEADFVWYMLRAVPDGRILFLQSHDRKSARTVQVRVRAKRPVTLWDAATGELTDVEATVTDDGMAFELSLAPAGSALLSIGAKLPGASAAKAPATVARTVALDGPWPIELAEPNTMPLDYWRLGVGDGELSEPMPTLDADRRIRESFGLSNRVGYNQQPWYLYATGNVDTSPRGACRLVTHFAVEHLPGVCRLGIERPEDFRVSINGRGVVAEADGWWVDDDIKTIDISKLVVEGDNEIALAFDYRPDMELEDLYLLGDFAVRSTAPAGQAPRPGQVAIVAPVRALAAGSWVGQGLAFYGGAVNYKVTVNKPAGGRVRLSLGEAACSAAAIHAGGRTYPLLWPPLAVEITDALADGDNEVVIELIGGRKNILGPLHTPWIAWTGPKQFDPDNPEWREEYLLNDHGLIAPPVVEIME